jgi:1,4-dihydroxy-2-naphthoyl-CoA hydrolase
MHDDAVIISEDVRELVSDLFANAVPNIGDVLGIRFTHLSKEEVIATMPVDQRTHQPFGLLHGGASVVLAESVCSVGAWLNIDTQTQMAVGQEINANHIRAVRNGIVRATGRPIHRGATSHVWEIRVETEAGKLVCISRCTVAVIKKK